MIGVAFEPRAVVRVGLIGHGGRGASLLHDLLGIPGVQVNAVCDLVKDRVEPPPRPRWRRPGQKRARRLLRRRERTSRTSSRRDDLDVVYIPTPWRWHVPMAVAAMEAGKHVVRGGPRRLHARGLLAARRHLRAHAPPLRDARELLLRRERADGAAAWCAPGSSAS